MALLNATGEVQSFFTDYLQSLKTLDLPEQLNGLLLIATTMMHLWNRKSWFNNGLQETIPFTKEQTGECGPH